MYMYEQEDYVPLNWDALSADDDVWATIKEEMDKKFSADCMLKIITKAKEVGLKDKDIFLPVEKEDEEEEKEEYVEVFESSIEDTTKDL
jgi:hypothetical protein